jgi:hypothetical protein
MANSMVRVGQGRGMRTSIGAGSGIEIEAGGRIGTGIGGMREDVPASALVYGKKQ